MITWFDLILTLNIYLMMKINEMFEWFTAGDFAVATENLQRVLDLP